MNGSRANPNAHRDIFQDYDIVYVVTEMAPFVHNLAWIERFGDMMVLQLPDEMGEDRDTPPVSYAYLMQFMDGNRIDLTIYPLAHLQVMARDSLSVLLLDKDGLLHRFRRLTKVITCHSRPPHSSSLTAATSFGGLART